MKPKDSVVPGINTISFCVSAALAGILLLLTTGALSGQKTKEQPEEVRQTGITVDHVSVEPSRMNGDVDVSFWFWNLKRTPLTDLSLKIELLKDGKVVSDVEMKPDQVPPGRVTAFEDTLKTKEEITGYRITAGARRKGDFMNITFRGGRDETNPDPVQSSEKGSGRSGEYGKESMIFPKRLNLGKDKSFPGKNNVEVAHWRFWRTDAETIFIQGGVRNGLDVGLESVSIEVKLLRTQKETKTVQINLSRTIHPEETVAFEKEVSGIRVLNNYSYSYNYRTDQSITKKKSKPWKKTRKNLRDLAKEREQKKKETEPEDPSTDSEKNQDENEAEPPVEVAVKGMKILRGELKKKNGKQTYTGDIYFLRLAIRKNEKPVKEGGLLRVRMFEGERPRIRNTRVFSPSNYEKRAEHLTRENAEPDMILYDRKKKELLVGLFKIGRNPEDFYVNVYLTLRNSGNWYWKNLRKPFRNLPLPPKEKDEED